jgi:hypothetical protein
MNHKFIILQTGAYKSTDLDCKITLYKITSEARAPVLPSLKFKII